MMDPRGHRGPSVLVVDDESDIRLMTRDLLEFDGYQVSEAANGTEALELLANESIHVLITDLYMPGLDGYDLIRQVLHSGRKAPRIIAVSGVATDLARPTDAEAASLLQVDAILDKPFTREQLVRALAATDEGTSPSIPATAAAGSPGPSALSASLRAGRAVRRQRIEAALGPELLESLWLLCDRLLIPREAWTSVPPLRILFTTLALQLAVEREVERGKPVHRARQEAAGLLDLKLGTWSRRMERWLEVGTVPLEDRLRREIERGELAKAAMRRLDAREVLQRQNRPVRTLLTH